MRKFAFVALITLVTSFASGQTKAPSMTVFGLELGKSFTIPECRLFKIAKRSFDYEGTDQVLCYRRFYDDVRSGPTKTIPEGIVTLNYPPTQLPALTLGVTARLITGNLEAVYISTPGARYSKENLEVLTAKYGSPTLSQKGIAVTTMGAQIETIKAGWSFADLSISFSSVFTRADSGLISIETTKGAAATVAAKIPEGPKL